MSKSNPVGEGHGDTHEFEALRSPEGVDQRTEFELVGNYRLNLRHDFREPIELRLGRDERTPTIYIVRRHSRLMIADHWDYGVVQPDVIRAYPGRGWVKENSDAIVANLGRGISPQFELGPDVSRHHCLIGCSVADQGTFIEIENWGRNGTRVLVHPDDLAREIKQVEPFEPGPGMWPDD